MSTETIAKRVEGGVVQAERTRNRTYYCPNVDIVETRDELTVFADLPGLRPEDISVEFENGTLSIHGVVRDRQDDSVTFLRREYGVGDFYRTFQVSEAIDSSRITAEYTEGVLTLHLPKQEAAKPRKIAVRSN